MTLDQLFSMLTNRIAYVMYSDGEQDEIDVSAEDLEPVRRIAEGVLRDLLAVGLEIKDLKFSKPDAQDG